MPFLLRKQRVFYNEIILLIFFSLFIMSVSSSKAADKNLCDSIIE